MKKEHLSKYGYLMLELMVGLATLSLCSVLVAQWYAQVISEEKKSMALVRGVLEMASVMHQIKAHRLPLSGSRQLKADTLVWTACSFGKSLKGHWVTITLKTRDQTLRAEKALLFGVI